MIGDSPEHDIGGAEATGIPTIWMNRHDLPLAGTDPSPTYVARNLGDVRELLA